MLSRSALCVAAHLTRSSVTPIFYHAIPSIRIRTHSTFKSEADVPIGKDILQAIEGSKISIQSGEATTARISAERKFNLAGKKILNILHTDNAGKTTRAIKNKMSDLQNGLIEIGEKVKKIFPEVALKIGPLKTDESHRRKMISDGMNNSSDIEIKANSFADLIRGAFIVDTNEEVFKIESHLKNNHTTLTQVEFVDQTTGKKQSIELKGRSKYTDPKDHPLHYSSANSKVTVPNHGLVELQVITTAMAMSSWPEKDVREIIGDKKFDSLKSHFEAAKLPLEASHKFYNAFRVGGNKGSNVTMEQMLSVQNAAQAYNDGMRLAATGDPKKIEQAREMYAKAMIGLDTLQNKEMMDQYEIPHIIQK